MLIYSFNPHTEKTALYNAILHFRQRWEQKHSVEAVCDLCDAIERAEEVYAELCRCQPVSQSELAFVACNLQLLIELARQELARVQDETVEEIGHQMATADRPSVSSPAPVLPAGTIVSCPTCEEGLYKVLRRASIDELVLDDGMLLQPLNLTIPKRDAWRALACPRCGGRYYKDGKLHTVQAGWQ